MNKLTAMMNRFPYWPRIALLGVAIGVFAPSLCHAQQWIVEDGTSRAQIVVAPDPPRLTRLAAEELRDHVLKMTGAELPIVNEASADYPTTVFVGISDGTTARGISVEGLSHGAFRMLSGDDWLALVGFDEDFEPLEPWPRNHGDRGRAQAEWEELTGGTWVNPMNSVFRDRHGASGIWTHDEGGSLQAVYAFLRTLGVRWYMPGELGEVVPQRDRIALPEVDRTVKPDFTYRDLRLGNLTQYPWEDVLWHFRLGLNDQGLEEPHGMRRVTAGDAMKEAHPEYYALYGGQRETGFRGSGHACFSSEGLLRETIAYARARFDHFNLPAVSVFPQDGYRHCTCQMCKDKTPSEVVWEFVERVAQALLESHPDRIVLGGAYSYYREPPELIEAFSPNVAVRISAMRPGLDDDARWADFQSIVDAWNRRLAPQRLLRNANIHGTASPDFPILHPRSIAREFSALRGISLGESSSVPRTRDQRWQNPGLSHLNLYVLSSYLWDATQDLDALLDEYYTLFYGPASDAMRGAFEFAESSYPRLGRPSPARIPIEDRIELIKRLNAARDVAGDTLYGNRVQAVLDDLTPLETLEQALIEREAAGDPRADAPLAIAGVPALDQPASSYRLRDIRTGEAVEDEIKTTFQVTWEDSAIVFAVTCHEPDMANIPVTHTVWGGDSVAILLETHHHAYYHIEINSEGILFDADWEHGRRAGFDNWRSMADIEIERGDAHWRLIVRIPVVPLSEGEDDPLHFVVGEKPTSDAPWFFNVGRTRGLDGNRRVFAFSPTQGIFHVPLRFGRLETVDAP